MSDSESWTIGRLLEWTTDYLRKRGADSPRLDAELLLAEARGCERIDLYTSFADEPEEVVRTAFRELVRRRAEGMPVAYLLGRREFYSLSFRVTPDVLIPRPETEHLVVRLLDLARARPAGSPPPRIIDVGTGSGIIAVCAARELPGSRLLAIDRSTAALHVAESNVAAHKVSQQVQLLAGDLLTALAAEEQFDFIVSNPPYITTREMAELPETVGRFEPHIALAGGEQGTDVIARLIPQAAQRLAPDGYLLLEVSPMIEPAVARLIRNEPRLELEPVTKDLAGLARVVSARRRA